MHAYETMRRDAAIYERPHFAFHEKGNRAAALFVIGEVCLEVFQNGLIQRAFYGVPRNLR